MILLINLMAIGMAAFGGLLVGAIIKVRGIGMAAVIAAAAMAVHLVAPKYRYHVDADGPTLYVTKSTFTAETTVPCEWRSYDRDNPDLKAWCVRGKSGAWEPYIVERID